MLSKPLHIKLIINSFCLFGFILISNGQALHTRTYGVKEGLTHSVIWGIFEDSRGYMWFGSYGNGVSQFDGTNFTNYTKQDGLSSNSINDIAEDKDGNIWLGNADDGIDIFDGKVFRHLSVDDGLASDAIIVLSLDRDNNMWIGTSAGLTKYNGDTLITYTSEDGLPSNWVNYITYYEDEMIINTSRGICTFKDNQIIPIQSPDARFPFYTSIRLNEETFMVGTYQNGLFVGKEDGWDHYNRSEYGFTTVNAIHKLTSDSALIGTDYGLFAYGHNRLIRLDEKKGLPTSTVLNIKETPAGGLWISYSEKGMLQIPHQKFEIWDQRHGLASSNIYKIIEKDDSGYYVSTNEGVYDFSGKEFQRNENSYLQNKITYDIDRVNNEYLFSTDQGIIFYDKKEYTYAPSFPIYDLHEDNNGHLWLSFSDGIIEVTFPGTKPKYDDRKYIHHLERNGFTNASTGPIVADKGGNLWISTNGDGLYYYNYDSFRHFSSEDGLTSHEIMTIELNNGHLWIGTINGLYSFDGSQFYNYLDNPNVFKGKINTLVFESDSILWVGHIKGVDRITLDTNQQIIKAKNYGYDEGFIGLETNSDVGIRDQKGNIWVGTIDGLIRIKTESFTVKQPPPKIHINNIKLFSNSTDWSMYSDQQSRWFQLPQELTLDHDNNHLTFEFIGVNQSSPEKVRYQWILDGFDGQWSAVSNQTRATYTNLPHGHYTFQVKSSNEEGIWNSIPAAFSFTIRPPFWKTWWFMLMSIISAVFVIIAGLKYRIAQIRRKEKNQRMLVEMELRALRAQMNPHFTFNTMNSIQHFVKKNDTEAALKYISKFSKLIRMILDNSSVEMITIEREISALRIYLEIESLRLENEFSYTIDIGDDVDPSYDKIPSMLLQPYVENAIWHGIMNKQAKGHISVLIDRTKNGLICIIEDDGVGRETAASLKSKYLTDHKSYGMLISDERLKLLNEMKLQHLQLKVIDLTDEAGKALGTRVEISIQQ